MRQPIEDAIRQLETELSLLKTRLPEGRSKTTGAHSPGKPGGNARAMSRKLQPSLASPSQALPAKPNREH